MPAARELMVLAETAVNEALWILDSKLADARRMQMNPAEKEAFTAERVAAQLTSAKVLLAALRIDAARFEALALLQALQSACAALEHAQDAEAMLVRVELMDALAERGQVHVLDDAIVLCQRAAGLLSADHDRLVFACSLLGDLCLARIVAPNAPVQSVADRGIAAYKEALRVAEASQVDIDRVVRYNFACLAVIAKSKSISTGVKEREIAQLLKKCVDDGAVSERDLREDDDLQAVRDRSWFQQLVAYATRAPR